MDTLATQGRPARRGAPAYPTGLIDVMHTPQGRRITVRPALPQDRDALAVFYAGLTRDTLRRRFHCAFSGLSAERVRELSDLSQVDHEGLLMMVATAADEQGEDTVVGQAGWQRVEEGVDGGVAEFALVVADAWQGQGLGPVLMQALVRGAARQRLRWLKASVLASNEGMLALMRRCGFWLATDRDEDGAFEVLGHVPRLAAGGWLRRFEPPRPWWHRLPRLRQLARLAAGSMRARRGQA